MNENIIPKKIHYCWFGNKEKPKKVKECIESWHKYLPEYEFIEWNESNFDISSNSYVKQAYEVGKFAYVSDYVRINALYKYGGIYMDTDVKVFKSFNDLLDNRCILGFEQQEYIATSFMACKPRHKLMEEFIDKYKNIDFYKENRELDLTTNVKKLTQIMESKGLQRDGRYQVVDGITIYPQEYFSPYDYENGIRGNTKNTYCEHLFLVSWLPWGTKLKNAMKKIIVLLFGKEFLCRARRLLKN